MNTPTEDIRAAYVFLREKNQTIPSESLEYIRHAALAHADLVTALETCRNALLSIDVQEGDLDAARDAITTARETLAKSRE